MPKRDSTNRPSQSDETGSFRGEYKRLEREYVLARSILAARHAKGMTKREFAKAIGTSKGKISRWERAEVVPRIEMLQRIADVTGIGFQIGIEPSLGSGEDSPGASSDRKRATRKSSRRKSTAQRSTSRTSAQSKTARRRSGATKTTRGASSARSTPSKRKGTTRRSS
jgi:transcriptional regulator with XRE-family HTH domain